MTWVSSSSVAPSLSLNLRSFFPLETQTSRACRAWAMASSRWILILLAMMKSGCVMFLGPRNSWARVQLVQDLRW